MEFGEKNPGTFYRNRKAVYAVVLDKQTSKLAVMIHNDKGFLPGGGLNEHESHMECLKRECIEETGYTLNIENLIGNAKQYFQSRQNESILNEGCFYAGTFGEFVRSPVDKDHELVWMDIKEAEKILFHRSHIWAVRQGFKILHSCINEQDRKEKTEK
ncbi:NUDIX domain-containing protein [Bacillus sp. NEB1478]|uniref:NUDIX domain-containing protein n=1 Tax=Bacillus sp. NEB1478 TaxID=3073816 RepID=UPI002873BAD7|nr:NUDIX domain-containing protein [Bacillus sp. NEB1478]WNB93610.1 NUDIX domain-containing protein [Bacillus sp. NEB1478]